MTACAKIVVLDGHTLNPGDLSWEPLDALGELTVYERTIPTEIVERAADAPIVLTNKTPLDAQTIGQLPKLRYIGVLATGYNVVDIAAARERNIAVTNVPIYGTDTVAQHTIAMMLELARNLGGHDAAVHRGEWSDCTDFCFATSPIHELAGKTLGIVGLGRIGLAVARIAAAMNMRTIATRRSSSATTPEGVDIAFVPLNELLAESDVVSLHCPLTADTERLVNSERLGRMKRTAVIINTARGQLVDPAALAGALRDGTIAGAAVDVLETEPPPKDNPLLTAPNCLITPHVAWYAIEARQRLMKTAVENVRAFLTGEPQNNVNF